MAGHESLENFIFVPQALESIVGAHRGGKTSARNSVEPFLTNSDSFGESSAVIGHMAWLEYSLGQNTRKD
jgi:hypothetical protein